jgi:hypothetical protein
MAIPASYSTVLIMSFCSFPLRFSIGAVKISKLERLEPAISYEMFVEDLDPVDSFSTTLTELLVRVCPGCLLPYSLIADDGHRRRKWPSAVSDKQPTIGSYPTMAKGLRTLAAPQRVYRDRTGRSVAARWPLNSSITSLSRPRRWTSMTITTARRV